MINKKQYKMLKRIACHTVIKDDISAQDYEICTHLKELGYINAHNTTFGSDHYIEEQVYVINEAGKSALTDFRRNIIKILISILAVLLSSVISIISIILQ